MKFCSKCNKIFQEKYSIQKFCSNICANRFNRNHFNNIEIPLYSDDLAEFIGIYLGDGHLDKYQITIYLNSIADAEYIEYVQNLCKLLFKGVKVTSGMKGLENCRWIKMSSVTIVNFLGKMGLKYKRIPKWIFQKNSYSEACMRGLIDTEGSISFKLYKSKNGMRVYKQLNFRNARKELMEFVRDNLIRLGFNPTKSLRRSLYLSTHEAIQLYREKVRFSNPKLIKRSYICDWLSYRNWRGAGVVDQVSLEN